MKKIIKSAALIFALALSVCSFTACEDKDNSEAESVAESSESSESSISSSDGLKSWGNITVSVPKGFTMTGGSIADEQDPDSLMLLRSDDPMIYYIVCLTDSDSAERNIASAKDMVSGEDVSEFNSGTIDWHGVEYSYTSLNGDTQMPCFLIAGQKDESTFQITSCGMELSSEKTQNMLESLERSNG